MKRSHIVMAVLCLFGMISLHAQQSSFYIGTNAGVNMSRFKYTEDLGELYTSSNSMFGVNGGLALGFEINNFTITTGVNYIQKGGEYQTDNFENEFGQVGFFTAEERLHFISVPILVGYRKYLTDNFALAFAIGPSINFGTGGNIDEKIEYFGSEEVDIEKYDVTFGEGVNEDYKSTQTSFQIAPSLVYKMNDKSKLTFGVTWDLGISDMFNERYKQANDFFSVNKGDQLSRSTMFTVGYEYHFSFNDKY